MDSIRSPVSVDHGGGGNEEDDNDDNENGRDDVVMIATMTLRVEMKMVSLDDVVDDPKESHPM